jgi:hypothetical protein
MTAAAAAAASCSKPKQLRPANSAKAGGRQPCLAATSTATAAAARSSARSG